MKSLTQIAVKKDKQYKNLSWLYQIKESYAFIEWQLRVLLNKQGVSPPHNFYHLKWKKGGSLKEVWKLKLLKYLFARFLVYFTI